MSDETDSVEQNSSSKIGWMTIVKAILTGLMTVLTALGVSSCAGLH